MKKGLKIILVLMSIGFVLPITRSYAKEEDKTAFTITTEEKFTLTFIDTSAIMKVRIWLKYDSKEDKYTIAVYKQEPNEKLDSFDLNGEKLYNGLKEKLTAIAQNKKIEKALTEASNSDVYLWLLSANPANMVDRNTLSGKLALNQQIMVMKKGNHREYSDYYKRITTVQTEAAKYLTAQVKVTAAERSLDTTSKQLIELLNTKKKEIVEGRNMKDSIRKIRIDSLRIRRDALTNRLDSIRTQRGQADSIVTRLLDEIPEQEKNLNPDSPNYNTLTIEIDRKKDTLADKRNAIIILDKMLVDTTAARDDITESIQNLQGSQQDINKSEAAIRRLDKDVTKLNKESIDTLSKTLEGLIPEKDISLIRTLIHQHKAHAQGADSAKMIVQKWQQHSIYLINKISLQFERGFLERIQVWVTVDDKQEIFENVYAIGFSSVSNFKNFKDIKLFARNSDIAFPFIYLSDVFSNYDNYLHNYTRDYSPADTAINEVDPADEKILNLSTERLINVFDSKIYTDLRGIAENQPNGLVQIDISKRFNLNTHRRQVFSSRNNFGYFNYIMLWGALTKIEKEDRVLQLRNDRVVINNTLVSPSYATNLDFRQYEMLSFGGDLNLLLFDRPDTKFTFYFDVGARYGITKVRDSVLKIEQGEVIVDANKFEEYDANTLTFFPRISAEVMSQQRVGFTVSYQYHYTYLLSNNLFKQVASYAKSQTSNTLLDTRARGAHMLELYVRIQTSENDRNKFFLRGRLFMQNGDMNTSFSQLQLGYSYNLFYKK